ncbi:MAG TPA: dihydropteroate synthase [Candidatus Aminicenantes bacterium]|nr:dihydropteroate synthase [Candidatus Aminicenantes bacterium]
MRIHLRNRYLTLEEPAVMGVINVTPDSFFDGGRYVSLDLALARAREMVDQGVDIIDVGGESTRPGARSLDAEEEANRVVPVIRRIKTELDIPVSVDTYKESVARRAVEEGGADIINDISGLNFSPRMAATAAELEVPVVIMHIKGTPENMQRNPEYGDVIAELTDYFKERVRMARSAGIAPDRILLDPGIGFGKRLQDNIEILKNLAAFRVFDSPLMVGVSRKSFLGALGGKVNPAERLPETLVAGIVASMHGASVLRVHDVDATVRALKVVRALGVLPQTGSRQ